ncbi:Inner kinetochore subunit [Lachnellula willkommii]|uniref:Inner kinetochore subunit n=1 Tax=Lachnellula willkommii TaxID=215461 RepID=A0A559MM39_9HELO|nr:Inner kinetochore subunit [Lachnellula willkommii]
MAAGQKLYPRATVKKIVKAHSKRNVTKNVDVLIFLDYALFLQTLMKEASINAKQAGERGISAKSVKKVTEVSFFIEVQGLITTSESPWRTRTRENEDINGQTPPRTTTKAVCPAPSMHIVESHVQEQYGKPRDRGKGGRIMARL